MSDKTKHFFAGLGKLSLTAALCGAIGGGTFVGVTRLADKGEEKEAAVVQEAAAEEEVKAEPIVEEKEDNTRLVSNDSDDRVEPAQANGGSVSEVVKSAMPSIVAVNVKVVGEYSDMFGRSTGQTYEAEGAGSGILVEQAGGFLYIVTNNHVVEDVSAVSVEFIDGESADAEIIGTDKKNDLAVIKIPEDSLKDSTIDAIRIATIGDSDSLSVGDDVIVIGNALGYGQSVTTGIVSALNREVEGTDASGKSIAQKLIQTDAAINPGNSGGAMLNSRGEVVGINSSKYAETAVEGMCFAIPVNTAKDIVQAMILGTYDELQKNAGYLGISCIDVTKEVSQSYNMPEGVYIANIQSGSAAEKAGLIEGQIITAVNGEAVNSSAALSDMIGNFKGGDSITLTVMTADRGTYLEETVNVVLGNRGDDPDYGKEEEAEEAPETQEVPEVQEQPYEMPQDGYPGFGGEGFGNFEDFFGSFFGQ